MENRDPFNQLPNSASADPGNQIDVLGLAMDNAYVGNYGQGSADTSAGVGR